MSNRWKRWPVLIGLTALVGLLLAACGGGASTQESSSGTESSPNADTRNVSGKVEIWDPEYKSFPGYTKAANAVDALFEKANPGVEVERVPQSFTDATTVYRAAFAAHEGPDIMSMPSGAAGVLAYANGLEVLNDQLSPEMQEELTQWSSATRNFSEDPSEDRYAVPVSISSYLFTYNKKMFKEAGLPTDFEPESWAEVTEAAEKLQAAGFQPFTGGNKEGLESILWFGMGLASEATEAQMTEIANGEIPFTDELVANAFKPLFETQEAGFYPSDRFSVGMIEEGCPRLAEGKGAMLIGFASSICYWGEASEGLGEKNVGVFSAPGHKELITQANNVWGIPKFAKNKEAALALLEFETSKEAMEVWDKYTGGFPNRTDTPLPADAPKIQTELLERALQQGTITAPLIKIPTAAQISMTTEINAALQGRTSLESALEAAQEATEKEPQ